jgi:predicted small secreted protein
VKEEKMKKLGLFFLCTMLLTACNTIQGIGKDVKKAGEVVEDAGKK